MTLPEVALALDDNTDERRPPQGGEKMDMPELMAYAEWLRSATPRERLERLRTRYQ